DDNADANTGARLHASRRFSRCETLRKFFEPLWEVAGEFNSVPILTPKLIPLGDCGRITNRNGGSGESRLPACSSRPPAANRFRAHIRLAKEDIRRSGRMQQAGSLRSPDPSLWSRQRNYCNSVGGWLDL